ncbi:MAG: hemolysin III family protein [Alphaproteobacteria bacterium]
MQQALRRPVAAFPAYTAAERRADAIVHVAGVAACVVAAALLLTNVTPRLPAFSASAVILYGASLVVAFAVSAAYNMVARAAWKDVLRRLDHAAIFVLIAGTYTPFGAVAIERHGGGGEVLVVVWAVAVTGVVLKLALPRRLERLSIVLYLLQGWAVLAAPEAFVAAVPAPAVVLLGAGGVLYTAGVAFHLWRRLPFQNAVWHLFVLAGAACHFAAVLATFA